MTGYLLLHINMLSLGGQITKIIPKQCHGLKQDTKQIVLQIHIKKSALYSLRKTKACSKHQKRTSHYVYYNNSVRAGGN